MSDATVGFLLENLQGLLTRHVGLIGGVEKDVQNLKNELDMLKAHLEDLTNKRRKQEAFKLLLTQIQEVVYKADDIVDLYIIRAAEKKKSKITTDYLSINLRQIALEVKGIASDVKKLLLSSQEVAKGDNAAADQGNADTKLVTTVHRPAKDIVGFRDEEQTIIDFLKKKVDKRDVITIVGLPGQGKTTLASMIFHNPEIQKEFPTRIWLYISQEFNPRSIFLQILRKLKHNFKTDEIKDISDEELAVIVATRLNEEHFLIVMDDVWTGDNWKTLASALPNSGKVLVTSRQVNVASFANPHRGHHQLRFLTDDEGLQLLKLEVLAGSSEFPPELEPMGKAIVEKCKGLPLAIVVIGGILVAKFPKKTLFAKQKEWKNVSEKVGAYINDDDTRKMANIIALSYDKLPYHLKSCFLYLGVFPEDYEIPARKLTHMWMAHGFIPLNDSFTYEEKAYDYLDDLMNRNLIQCEKVGRDGRVKTCRIHDVLRDFCIKEGEKEKARRCCIPHSNLQKFLPSISRSDKVRSFVSLPIRDHPEVNASVKQQPDIPSAFTLLRVMESKPIIFPTYPSSLFKLAHLRYITISVAKDEIPPAFSKLWNIQTLIVHTKSSTIKVKVDILEMVNLRHFETNASAVLVNTTRSSSESKLQTLGKVSPESCTKELIAKARNVKNLSIRGQLALLLGPKNESFNNLGNLDSIEKLKLLNDSSSHSKLLSLPQANKFPRNLTSLTLTKTYLGWDNMGILSQLEKLEILILKEKAFMGDIWNSNDGGFQALVILHIEHVDFVKWTCSGRSFPRLTQLVLEKCKNLAMVPVELADSPYFEVLNLKSCNSAVSSAQEIKKIKEETDGQGNKQGHKFLLSISTSA